MDLNKRTRKNDTSDSTQNAPAHRTNKKESITDTNFDQDSDVSFSKDSDKEIDADELEQEDLIEDMKRSTAEAEEKMNAAKIPCWIENIEE